MAILAAVAILVLGAGAVFAVQRFGSSTPGEQTSISEPEKRVGADTASVVASAPAEVASLPAKEASDPRFAFLLLGYGGGGHEGGYLTDSIVVAIADPSQKTLTLLSIPRDCWVPLLFDGNSAVYNKVNTAYAFARDSSLYRNRLPRYTGDQGAGNFASDTVSRLLGIPISNYLSLDFAGFREMIDAVGGIDVYVPNSFSAQYPVADNPAIDPRWKIVRFTQGVEHMDGERAIQYARARQVIDNPSESGDFARSRRQRIIMEAFKTRLLDPGGLIHVPQLIAIAAQHVDTNYAIPDVGQFSQFALDWKDVKTYQTALTIGNYLAEGTGPGGAYILVPNAEGGSWAQIRAFARRLWQNPSAGVAMANTRITVVNCTGELGAATRLSSVLAKLGYRVGTPATGETRAKSRLLDGTQGEAQPLAEQLTRDLGLQVLEVAERPDLRSDEVVLELGTDDVGLATLEAPIDNAAPSSAPGVQVFGSWVPNAGPPAPTKPATLTPTPRRTVAPTATATASPTASLTATITPTRTRTPSPTPTRTPSVTRTPTVKPTGTPTVPRPTATATATITPKTTKAPGPKPTSTATATEIPLTTPTGTRTPSPLTTPMPTATLTTPVHD